MGKVFLLGDSIRLSYQSKVAELLGSDWAVDGPKTNCMFSGYTLRMLSGWLGEAGKVDVIHWNNGIWDLSRVVDGDVLTQLDWYLDNMKRILKILVNTGAKVIWASTTPVADNHPMVFNSDMILYNSKVNEIMNAQEIEINDLNKIIMIDRDRYLNPDGVHMNPEGVEKCADAAVKSILKVWNKQGV